MNTLTHALKEWFIAIQALEAGKTIILLRKGGIREQRKQFQVPYRRVWLYPTYEHQKPHLLKPEYASQVKPVESGWHPEQVQIGSYGEITYVFSLTSWEKLQGLEPYHIWNEQMISDRWQWKPNKPLSVLFLRIYQLPQPMVIPYHQSYGGCRSWIELQEPIILPKLAPILPDNIYQQQVKEIVDLLE